MGSLPFPLLILVFAAALYALGIVGLVFVNR